MTLVFGVNSTSIIEFFLQELKAKIQHSYYIIPSYNFVSYLREAEYKIKIKHMTSNEKLKDFMNDLNVLII